MNVTVIIPARYASTRFPGKVLADATGRTMIEHVYQRAAAAQCVDRVVVATDNARIAQAVADFGGHCVRTRGDHPNGSSRIAEAVQHLQDPPDVVVNVQGDEPEIEPALINEAVDALIDDSRCVVSTLASPIEDPAEAGNPNIVKVVVDQAGRALLFSRSAIPHARAGEPRRLKHIGLYAYRAEFLARYASLTPTPLEQTEQLEQLRILEHGLSIAVRVTAHPTPAGVDTPEQYAAFVERWRSTSST